MKTTRKKIHWRKLCKSSFLHRNVVWQTRRRKRAGRIEAVFIDEGGFKFFIRLERHILALSADAMDFIAHQLPDGTTEILLSSGTLLVLDNPDEVACAE